MMLCEICLKPESDLCDCVGEDGEDALVFDPAEEIGGLRAELAALEPLKLAARAYKTAVSRLDDREGALATLGRAAVSWAASEGGG